MLNKFGSQLKILKTAAVMEDVLSSPSVEVSKQVVSKVLEPKNQDFLYYRARAISAGDQGPLQKDGKRGFNYNGNKDYFPRKELEAAYPTFVGRNIFLDHNSESSLYSVGKIIDALPIDDKETGEFYIELVGKIDRTLHPEICRKIETGELNSTSMGCSVEESICSICGHVLHSDADEKCDHMGMNLGKEFPAEVDLPEYNIKKGDLIPCFSINKGVVFNEDSIVGVPADPTAVIKTVLSNVKHKISKKASLTKTEQLELISQMDKLFDKLDDVTRTQLRADFCRICPPVEKESSMVDKNIIPSEDTKNILNKISAYEMEQLESYITHKTKKAAEEKAVIADAVAKEESFISRIVAKVKDVLSKDAGLSHHCKHCSYGAEDEKSLKEHMERIHNKASLVAMFDEDKNNVLNSTWSVSHNGNLLVQASLNDIWGSKFALLSFDDQRWATSAEYAQETVTRLVNDGLPKLAEAWDVADRISKTAANGEFFKAKDFFVPGSDSANRWKPEDIKKHDEKDGHVVTEYTFKFPGQENSRGQISPGISQVRTEYDFKRQEGVDFKPGQDSSNDFKPDEVKAADEGKGTGYGHVPTEYSFKRQPGKEFVGGSDSQNDFNPDEIKRDDTGRKASLKTAENGEFFKAKNFFDPTKNTTNKVHTDKEFPTVPQFEMPGKEVGQKGPANPGITKTPIEYKLDLPGQDAGQKGPANPKITDVKTEYELGKPNAKEVKTTPKNPEEKKLEKSEKDVKTDYVPEGKERMEEEEKSEKKSDKKSSLHSWSALSEDAQVFIKKHVKKHMEEDGMKQDQAVAAAYSEAREKGFDVPTNPKESSFKETAHKHEVLQMPCDKCEEIMCPGCGYTTDTGKTYHNRHKKESSLKETDLISEAAASKPIWIAKKMNVSFLGGKPEPAVVVSDETGKLKPTIFFGSNAMKDAEEWIRDYETPFESQYSQTKEDFEDWLSEHGHFAMQDLLEEIPNFFPEYQTFLGIGPSKAELINFIRKFRGTSYHPHKAPYEDYGTGKMGKQVNLDNESLSMEANKISDEAEAFISKEIKHLIDDKGYDQDRAEAAAYSVAREKGYDVPEKKSSQDIDLNKQAATAGDKPEEAVDGSTQTEGKKTMGDKVEESVQGTTVPNGKDQSKVPETSVKDEKTNKTPNLTKKPEESVEGTTLPKDNISNKEKSDESSQGTTFPSGKKTMGDESEKSVQALKTAKIASSNDPKKTSNKTVNKSAATEMLVPEKEDVTVKVDEPKVPVVEQSVFDVDKTIEIGEGYSAVKDKATNEVVISKDGKEVKRLPDGFGVDIKVVLPLLKAVLGLPAMDAEKPGEQAPVEQKTEEPKSEAHEDELELKESSLKVKEAELAKKEAVIQAKEAAIRADEQSKRFASVIQARAERCKKIVAALVEKDALQMDRETYEYELKNGTYLLDAQKKAFEHAITAKQKELLAMDDNALLATEKVIADLKTPATLTNTKKASRLFVSPSFVNELSEDEYLAKIFNTFGTKNHPQ